ncbi:MAG: type IV pilus modification PilV family protein, partial [Rhodanobacter sp.]
MHTSKSRHRGFGLIEILVTLGVLSMGIVGVTVLHATVTKQSSENKSRAEALAIAQSRIEEMRNYTGHVDSLSDFNTLFANTSGFANSSTITGTNATYTRAEEIGAFGALKTLTVRVTWQDDANETLTVSLSTRLGYIAPRSIGDTARETAASVVDAPMGRARLGEGGLPENAVTASNGDGTSLFQDGGADLMLVSNNQIVLTLTEACQTEDGTCMDFVKIKGRIYIDQGSQSSLHPGEVYVIASDAAFCARHFMAANASAGDEATPVTTYTTNTRLTANGDYEWFDYTCYLGGGWYGNIGISLAGGLENSDKICVGDPVTADAWATPVIASRRVYRGMLYKPD